MICILIVIFSFVLEGISGVGFVKYYEPLMLASMLETPFDLIIGIIIGNLFCYFYRRCL